MKCPCGLEAEYTACCGRYIEGESNPPTPEALMRSRYTAYARKNFCYIQNTMSGEVLALFDRDQAEREGEKTEFLELQVLSSEDRGEEGVVEFIAFFQIEGKKHMMHERSLFHKTNGKWFYVSGDVS